MKQNEADRLYAITESERHYWENGVFPGGMDEVGRGPLAGPVVCACIVLPSEPLIEYVKDSKKLSELRREKLYPKLCSAAICCGIGSQPPEVIDEINILQATKLAFKQAYESMQSPPEYVLVDAVKNLDIAAKQTAIIHGDALSYLIAAASIVAKVTRDRYMAEMAGVYPEYGFERNKGYGTREHIEALKKYGPCPIHRKSFIGNFVGERK